MSEFHCVMPSPFGCLGITLCKSKFLQIKILQDIQKLGTFQGTVNSHPALIKIIDWLNGYFVDPFSVSANNIAFCVEGTPFQKKVWHALLQIPIGETTTYGELAKKLNTSPRAIGAACRTNPTPIIVPCHRVVAKNGLGGFMGEAVGGIVDFKFWLLSHEKNGVSA